MHSTLCVLLGLLVIGSARHSARELEVESASDARRQYSSKALQSLLLAASSSLGRRKIINSAAAAAAFGSPLAALADGAQSPRLRAKTKNFLGAKVYALQGRPAREIIDNMNVIDLYIVSAEKGQTEMQKKLRAIKSKIIESAENGDASGCQAGLDEFLEVARIEEAISRDIL
mmetsp:Transcript_76847/g.120912  ORF Transcript_76847/g.120912 Transcript_76847/m.120912 type:complete len:173 (-) Transcript_76847:242-760(-)